MHADFLFVRTSYRLQEAFLGLPSFLFFGANSCNSFRKGILEGRVGSWVLFFWAVSSFKKNKWFIPHDIWSEQLKKENPIRPSGIPLGPVVAIHFQGSCRHGVSTSRYVM